MVVPRKRGGHCRIANSRLALVEHDECVSVLLEVRLEQLLQVRTCGIPTRVHVVELARQCGLDVVFDVFDRFSRLRRPGRESFFQDGGVIVAARRAQSLDSARCLVGSPILEVLEVTAVADFRVSRGQAPREKPVVRVGLRPREARTAKVPLRMNI